MSRRLITALAATIATAASAPALAAPEPTAPRAKPWATINVCDTEAYPNVVGIRASAPAGKRRGERLFVRFQVQFYRPSNDSWHHIGPSADSGFVQVGAGKAKVLESGRNFTLEPPPRRTSHVVRGVVTFEWRRGAAVVRRVRKATQAGHPNTVGADPAAFSAATCEIR